MQIPGEIIVEYAWLGKDETFWSFYSENSGANKRQWEKREHAVKDLMKEGWSITALYYEEGSEQELCAYGMVRLVH